MSQRHSLCFVIADGSHARFVYPAGDNALHTAEAVDSANAHKQTHDLVSDRQGRTFESGSLTRHAFTPRHDPHEMEKTRFAHWVGERVKEAADAGSFEAFVLVAPSHVLNEIIDTLDGPTKTRLSGTLAKDLANVPDHELWPHLKEWVRPTHRS